MIISNLLLIAGTGNKSGKTTFACRVIEQFRGIGIIGIKITPHFHETTPGLVLMSEKPGYSIYEETNPELSKDTSRMLKAGASKVFFAKVTDENLLAAFKEIMKHIPTGNPIVCESPALRYYIDPGLFIIMKSKYSNNKNINELLRLPHVMFHLNDIIRAKALSIEFKDGKWSSSEKTL
ncbi:MAG: hypothetical protein NTZ85_15755 [Bacteroidia bacterium]|nr:hypothetical protein [Bacteroidia bacterium]